LPSKKFVDVFPVHARLPLCPQADCPTVTPIVTTKNQTAQLINRVMIHLQL